METILIVDDEKNYTLVLSAILQEESYETLMANDSLRALEIIKNSDINLVITDMKMPKVSGIELLESIKKINSDLPVIIMTAYGTIEKAVEAMQKGAYNFILKPFDNQSLIIYVKKALENYKTLKENRELKNAIKSNYNFNNIIGKSKSMQDIFKTIQKIASANATVLIEGESGTGKELIAKSIHCNSLRCDKPFIAVNCAALSENLLESELFGHERGAFTGAFSMKKGRFEISDGGTLFLDEIGELSQSLQVKLLRVLQEKSFERVGGTKPISVNIRIIAATNKNLKKEVEKGNFREDLFYRLNVLYILIPPLRERTEDIHILIKHFIDKYKSERKSNIDLKGISQKAEQAIYNYQWPGNIRELENVIERAAILCSGEIIELDDLPSNIIKASLNSNFNSVFDYTKNKITDNSSFYEITNNAKLYPTLISIEKYMIERAMKSVNNIQSRAAQILGITKSGLSQKLKKYKIISENLIEQ